MRRQRGRLHATAMVGSHDFIIAHTANMGRVDHGTGSLVGDQADDATESRLLRLEMVLKWLCIVYGAAAVGPGGRGAELPCFSCSSFSAVAQHDM